MRQKQAAGRLPQGLPPSHGAPGNLQKLHKSRQANLSNADGAKMGILRGASRRAMQRLLLSETMRRGLDLPGISSLGKKRPLQSTTT
tara:strand:+ start:186 stop:446 length:261 start_codon:yes stop_codon:yes gene_type:complete